MKQYEKPMVEINCNCSEGVYAASGKTKHPLCDSDYMNGFQAQNDNGTTYMSHYGCSGCPQNRFTHCAFDESADYDDSGQSGTYETKVNLPAWERHKMVASDPVGGDTERHYNYNPAYVGVAYVAPEW